MDSFSCFTFNALTANAICLSLFFVRLIIICRHSIDVIFVLLTQKKKKKKKRALKSQTRKRKLDFRLLKREKTPSARKNNRKGKRERKRKGRRRKRTGKRRDFCAAESSSSRFALVLQCPISIHAPRSFNQSIFWVMA